MTHLSTKQLVLTVVLSAILAVSSWAVIGSAAASGGGLPAPAAGGSLGVVTIYPNGTISNPAAPISVSGSDYSLTGELNGALEILASNVLVDGAGHTVNYTAGMAGGDDASITVSSASQVTVENFGATNASIGVWVDNSTSVTILGNDLPLLEYSIEVSYSSEVTISSNQLNYSLSDGVYAYYVTSLSVTDNSMVGDGASAYGYALYAEYCADLVVTGNDANGTYYGFDAVHSTGVLFANDNASFSYYGFGAYYGQNVRVENNNAFESEYGTGSEDSTNVTIANNFEPYNENPIWDEYDTGVLVEGNYAPWSLDDGIYSYESSNVSYVDNDLSSTYYGAYIESSLSVMLRDNNFSNASYNAVYLDGPYGNTSLVGNDLSEPSYGSPAYGVYDDWSYGPIWISGNTINNLDIGIYLESQNGPVSITGDTIRNASWDAVDAYEPYGPVSVIGSDLSNSNTGVEYDYGEGGGLTVSGNIMNGTVYGVYDNYGYAYGGLTVTNNQIADSLGEAVYAYSILGPVTITGNDLANASSYGVYLKECYYGATTIANNNVSNAGDEAIYSYEGLGANIVGNDVRNSSDAGIDVEYDYGPDQIVGNDVQSSQDYGIYDYYNEGGGVLITGNNVTGSYEGLDVDYSYYGTWITGNDFANNPYVYAAESLLTQVSGNDFLNVSDLTLYDNTVGLFYHNDVNSSGFDPISNTVETTWNAAYPLGGNYWTGYSGTDAFSGPNQNQPGSDGIGDTPYAILGQTDAYPLMRPWISAVTTFTATGLSSGATWSVTLNGVTESAVAGSPVVFVQTNGAYTSFNYTVQGPAGYHASPSTGSGTMTGSDRTIAITFSPVRYNVTLTESGLAAGTLWGVEVGGTWTNGTTASLSMELTNGTYPYTAVTIDGYTVSPSSGTFTVQGANVSLSVSYTEVTYTFTFTESGLPTGSTWNVTVGPVAKSTTAGSITFQLPAGTYSFSVTGPSGYTITPGSGSVTASGSNVTVYVAAATTPSPAGSGTSSSGGSNVSSTAFYGVLGGLLAALVLAIVGWVLYLRRREARPPTPTSWSPPPGVGGSPPEPPPTPP